MNRAGRVGAGREEEEQKLEERGNTGGGWGGRHAGVICGGRAGASRGQTV